MEITRRNVGDTLCLYQTGEHIHILEVKPQFVFYAHENGSHYAARAKYLPAFPVRDELRLAAFERNYSYGKVLNGAEMKARELLRSADRFETEEARDVLASVQLQLNLFATRLKAERAGMVPGREMAGQFLSELAEQSTGSKDMFWGHKVQLVGCCMFQVDGKTMDYTTAKEHLGNVRFIEPVRKPSLNDTINAARTKAGMSASAGVEVVQARPER